MKIKGLSVEIGSEKCELPEIRSDLLGQGLKEIVRYKTHQQVDFLYIKSLDKYVDDYKTLSEMNIVDRDVFIGSFYESSFDLDNTNNNNNNVNNDNNNFNGISNFYHNVYDNYRKKWENCLTGDDNDDDINNFIIDDEEDDTDYIPDIEIDFSPLYVSKRYTDISDYLKSDDPFHVVNLFHIISIVCCILSLFVWFTELIPCALSWMVFEVSYNYEVLTKYGRALLWADVLVTTVVFGILLTIFIGLVVTVAEKKEEFLAHSKAHSKMGMTWPKKSKIVDSTKILSVNSLESDPAYRIATTAPETLPIAKVPSFHKLSRTSSNVIHFSESPSSNWDIEDEGVPTVLTWSEGGVDVYVVGTFNGWQEKIPLTKSAKDFATIQYLPVGVHHYKFIVDGELRHDPKQPVTTDPFGHLTNMLEVRKKSVNQENMFENSSPAGSYSQSWEDDSSSYSKDPPSLPPHLYRALLNTAPVSEDDPVLLPLPHHVIINHTYFLSRTDVDNVEVYGATHRYKSKFVTTVFYKPACTA